MVAVPFPVELPEASPFGPHNIPFGIFSTPQGVGLGTKPRAGVALGDYVIELHELARRGVFDAHQDTSKILRQVFLEPTLNSFAALEGSERRWVRQTIIENVTSEKSVLFTDQDLNEKAFVLARDTQMHLPMDITDYTDSFSSLIHAENSLKPLGLDLPPAFKLYPLGYNGRCSSIFPSGHQIHRPSGFFIKEGETQPAFQISRKVDFEIELGAFISKPVPHGQTIDAKTAADHIFGYVLHNDWSARDIQPYEMPPLGPMHSKGFVTTISPWIVTVDALASCCTGPPTSNATPIHSSLVTDEASHGVYDIEFTASVARKFVVIFSVFRSINAEMSRIGGGNSPVEIVRSNYRHSYWSVPQMIAYQSSGGWGINTGDLVASGTVSSPAPEIKKGLGSYGCLLECFAQQHELPAVGGKSMSWLEDGDELAIQGWFRAADGRRCGFGKVSGVVVPGPSWPS
ncbi:fumarylacetoacetase [Fonsecaea pedrosoi CBS 271.37]|uniref:Fumarylacetoacetase n=1 Tax=Fonsecaea pedrosoi CBS 271.37 TaxID=1442368 RepID=A0A0D2H566_9EURO|nr:fumarylacetoacetase [Fonsecaea pedrosoi CBS 271.37]KIW85995.1 fumarylacetoacetase [Fonsecaea pedrosoi CBS 271.37]